MFKDHATFTILKAAPQAMETDGIREELANAPEPCELYKVTAFDHDGPFPGHLEVEWLPHRRHIALCWDHSADVPRLVHADKWWGEEAESGDARCLIDGIEEYLNEHEAFTAEHDFHHGRPPAFAKVA